MAGARLVTPAAPPTLAQKHPEKWVVQRPEGGGPSDPPAILLPPIEEMFPLEACLQVGWGRQPGVSVCVCGGGGTAWLLEACLQVGCRGV